jgi:hypothetical protein
MNNERIKYFVEANGYNLEKTGIKSFGFLKEDSLKFIDILLMDDIPVLGGDVLLIDNNGKIQLIFDGWYCDKKECETDEQYTKRSRTVAKNYIQKYKNESICNSGNTFLFDIVFDRKIFLELFFSVRCS